MKVKITDVVTSMKLMRDAEDGKHFIYLGFDLKSEENGSKYGWAFRVNHHTEAEIAEGKQENPQVITMPMEELCEKLGMEIDPNDVGKTFVAFPQTNGISFFTSYCPAYEVLPDGVPGELVEVEIE